MTPKKTPETPTHAPIGQYKVNEANYAWYMGLMGKLLGKVGLNLKVHGDKQLLHDGDIFLFNHFVHLETTLPPYIIFEETGAFTRSIAHRDLFEANEKFARFIAENGAIPHDHPQLFPLMVAEILRGRKVVIFPEGRLVRDRRVVDANGRLGVMSDRDKVFRPLHRGGAALGVTLDILKTRLRQIAAAGDERTFGTWAAALEVDPEVLRKAIAKPTVLVPATITYYPINTMDNPLSSVAKLVAKGVSRAVLNEMILQGNMLLHRTDMDILLGKGIEVQRESPRWQTLLLEAGLVRINTVDQLFKLKDSAEGWAEHALSQLISRATDGIRDIYMEELYSGMVVNQSHLAARLIMQLLARGQHKVGKAFFHRAVYLAVKGIQRTEGLHLHRSVTQPERYRGLLEGENAELQVFMDTCKRAGLLSWDATHYTLSEKLHDENDYNKDRLANPVALYANETAPLPGVREVVDNALSDAVGASDRTIARLLFDDELRSYEWRRAFFSTEKFREINDKENPQAVGEPFLLMPRQPTGTGVLLVHGFRASPAQMRGVADKLLAQGHMVLGVRLAGHGTSPWDLHERTWQEWLDSVRRGYRILAGLNKRMVVVGFSTGAALSLYLASEQPEKLAGVVSVAAPLALQDRNIALVPWVSKLNRLVSTVTGNDGVVPFYSNEPDNPNVSYRALPVQAVQQLVELMALLKKQLPLVTAPVLVLQADADPVVSPESAREIYTRLGSTQKVYEVIAADRHGILHEDIGATQKLTEDFIASVSAGSENDGK
ncbi:MAG TPA: alpha/beta fold hydrolase [Alphaproteobacteria bacterium]|nr:alpha/beta fold hydrolase [Alphaproteobacteria bacterium]